MKIFNKIVLKERRKQLRIDQTKTEALLWKNLRRRQLGGYKFFRQYGIGGYIVDFYCPEKKVVIELDGSGHAEIEQREYDKIRDEYLRSCNIIVIRFWNNEVFQNLEGVLESILSVIKR